MIFDKLDNFKTYICIHPYFEDVFHFIRNNDLTQMTIGMHVINEKSFYASVSEYETKKKSEAFIECHRKYIDIQLILKGHEKIGICNKADCIEYEYNEKQDLQKLEGEVDFISLKSGVFAIFFPHDGHMPQVRHNDIEEVVKKVVFKIPVLKHL
ncbi:MAG: YhcH/YjgK/YiaL family protein [Desulfobacterales bacterium]|nr:YhcH/YjgK/YiaL family protein [Desulfobacterales bacterium]